MTGLEWVSSFPERFSELTKGLTAQQVAELLGVGRTTVTYWRNGTRNPKSPTIKFIAQKFNVHPVWLLGGDVPRYAAPIWERPEAPDNILPAPAASKKPLVGEIACGTPILAEENVERYLSAPEGISCDFCLRCRGDSMTGARIYDGDIVFVRQQETVENGQIAVVLIDGEATLKRVRFFPDHIVLEPENPQYRPLTFWDADMAKVHIEGLAVAFVSTVR